MVDLKNILESFSKINKSERVNQKRKNEFGLKK